MIEVEKKVLGAVLIDSTIRHTIIPMLNEEMFTTDLTRKVYRAMRSLQESDKPIDHITVLDQLAKSEVLEQADAYNLTTLSDTVATSANAEYHARLLIEEWLRAQVSAMAIDYSQTLQDRSTDVFDTLERFSSNLMGYINNISTGKIRSVGQVTEIVMREAIEARESADHLSGLPSGLFDLDMLTKGFKAPQLVIIAARPAMGKTALMMNIGRNYANEGPVGIFSLEMSAEELTRRLISMQTGIETHKIETGQFENIDHSIAKVAGLPIYINDTAGLNTQEIQVSARKMVSQYGCKALFVDYIQLMHGAGKYGNRETEVSEISRTLKRVAKTLKVPVVALSQLSRKCEERGNKRPMLSDLRESGAIEQDADIVIFMYRPEYYGEMQSEHGESLAGVTELIVAKQRSGPTGTVFCHFNKVTTSFGKHESDFEPF